MEDQGIFQTSAHSWVEVRGAAKSLPALRFRGVLASKARRAHPKSTDSLAIELYLLSLDKCQVEYLAAGVRPIVVDVQHAHISRLQPIVELIGAAGRAGDDRVGDVAVDLGIVHTRHGDDVRRVPVRG